MSADVTERPTTTAAPGAGSAATPASSGRGRAVLSAVWPKVVAVLIVIVLWQLIYASGWKPDYRFASPRRRSSGCGSWSPATARSASGWACRTP